MTLKDWGHVCFWLALMFFAGYGFFAFMDPVECF